MQTDLLTIKDVTQRYRCTPITVRRWIAAGVFPPPLRIGRRKVLWLRADIEKFERFAADVATRKSAPLHQLIPDPGIAPAQIP